MYGDMLRLGLCEMVSGKKTTVLINVDLALQVLDDVIMTRWKVLPKEQCLGNPTREDLMCLCCLF